MLNKTIISILLLILPSVAMPHAVLEYSEPASRSKLYRSPTRIVLTFNEQIELSFAKIIIMDHNDKVIVSNSIVEKVENEKSIGISFPKLPVGTYFVQYSVISVDGHKVLGRYKFNILDKNSTP